MQLNHFPQIRWGILTLLLLMGIIGTCLGIQKLASANQKRSRRIDTLRHFVPSQFSDNDYWVESMTLVYDELPTYRINVPENERVELCILSTVTDVPESERINHPDVVRTKIPPGMHRLGYLRENEETVNVTLDHSVVFTAPLKYTTSVRIGRNAVVLPFCASNRNPRQYLYLWLEPEPVVSPLRISWFDGE